MRTTKQQQQAREKRLKELLAVDGVVLASVSTGYIGDTNREDEEVVRNLDIEELRKTTAKKTKQESKQTGGSTEMKKTIEEQIKQLRRDSVNIDVELLEVKDSKTGEDYVLILDVNLHHLTYKDGKLDLSNSFNEVRILPKNSNILNGTSESFYNRNMQIFKNLPYRTSINIAEGTNLMEVLTKYINEKLKNNNKIVKFFEELITNYLENIKDMPEVLDNKDIEGTDKIVKNVTARKIVKNEFKNFGGDDASVTLETVKDYRGINQTIAKVNNGYPQRLEYKKTLLEDNKKGTTEKDLNIFINKLKRGYIKLLEIKELYNIVKLNENTENFRKCEKLHQFKDGEPKQEQKQQATKQQKQEPKQQKQEQKQQKQEEQRQEQKQQKQQETEEDVKMEKMEKMEEMMALVQELTEQNKQAIAKIEQLEEKIEENKPFYKKIADKVKKAKDATVAKVKKAKDATVAKVKEVKDASVAKVKEVKDATVAKVKEVTVEAIIAIIPSVIKAEIQKQGIQERQAEETKQGNQEKQETPKQATTEQKQETSRIDAKVQNIEKARIKKIFKDQGDEVALFFSLKTLYRVQTVGGKIYNIKKDSTADEIAEMLKAS